MNAVVEDLPDWLAKGIETPVAVFGAGASGKAASDLLESLGASVAIYDESAVLFDENAAARHGLAVFSPGFARDHPWLTLARSNDCRAIPEFDLAAALWKGPIVAVTGTNGKTTLTSFLNRAFRHVGIESYVAGNIGKPLCALLAEDCNRESIAVCEVSSFQAEAMEVFRADHVLWTNFDEDHLDRHESLQSYFRCKYKLVERARGSSLFIDSSVFEYGKSIGLDLPESSVVPFENDLERLGLRGSVFETEPELNSYLMARALWISLTFAECELVEAARQFEKSPHRIERLGEKSGIRFWDDSKATNLHATLGCLRRFETPSLWIGGGKDKGSDAGVFAERVAPFVKAAVLIGETRFELKSAFESAGIPVFEHASMQDAVARVFEIGESGDNAVLSPGFASFDMFENYVQRGLEFRKSIDCF